MPNPIDNEELYNQIELGNLKSPGKVTLSGHDRKIDWDVKVGPNMSGASTTLKGVPPVEFTATFYLVQDVAQGVDDFADWPAFLNLINSTVSGKKPKALDIYHPDLAANDIRSVVKKGVGGMVHDGKGGATVAVTFLEYKPPKPKTVTPLGSKKAEVDPNAAAKEELARLTKQYQETPWG
jgi:hypothetical protein